MSNYSDEELAVMIGNFKIDQALAQAIAQGKVVLQDGVLYAKGKEPYPNDDVSPAKWHE